MVLCLATPKKKSRPTCRHLTVYSQRHNVDPVTGAAIDIRLVGLDAEIVSEAEIKVALPEAILYLGRVFVFDGWEDGCAVPRDSRSLDR